MGKDSSAKGGKGKGKAAAAGGGDENAGGKGKGKAAGGKADGLGTCTYVKGLFSFCGLLFRVPEPA